MEFPKKEFVERKRTKAVVRLQATRVASLVPQLEEAKDALDSYLAGVLARYLATFAQHFVAWSAAVACVAELDCLLSLAKTSAFGGGTVPPPPKKRSMFASTTDLIGWIAGRAHVQTDFRGRRARGNPAPPRGRGVKAPLHHHARSRHLHSKRHQVGSRFTPPPFFVTGTSSDPSGSQELTPPPFRSMPGLAVNTRRSFC